MNVWHVTHAKQLQLYSFCWVKLAAVIADNLLSTFKVIITFVLFKVYFKNDVRLNMHKICNAATRTWLYNQFGANTIKLGLFIESR